MGTNLAIFALLLACQPASHALPRAAEGADAAIERVGSSASADLPRDVAEPADPQAGPAGGAPCLPPAMAEAAPLLEASASTEGLQPRLANAGRWYSIEWRGAPRRSPLPSSERVESAVSDRAPASETRQQALRPIDGDHYARYFRSGLR